MSFLVKQRVDSQRAECELTQLGSAFNHPSGRKYSGKFKGTASYFILSHQLFVSLEKCILKHEKYFAIPVI